MEKDPYGFTEVTRDGKPYNKDSRLYPEITRGRPHKRIVTESIEDLDKEVRASVRVLRTLTSVIGKLRKTLETQERELNKIRLAVGLLDYWKMPPHKRFRLVHNLSDLMLKINEIIQERKEFKDDMWSERREKILLVKRYEPDRYAKGKELYDEMLEEAEIELGYKKKPKVVKESTHDNKPLPMEGRL